ncbi:MAG: hypothetical protein GY739_04020 [Mesoflavibacter sp.]|nr:hypothetical protein [Mesoflavibacter sp.]
MNSSLYFRPPLAFLVIPSVLKVKREPTSQTQLSKSEIIKIIYSISVSNQTKKVDSLHSAKIETDSLKID